MIGEIIALFSLDEHFQKFTEQKSFHKFVLILYRLVKIYPGYEIPNMKQNLLMRFKNKITKCSVPCFY